MAYKNPYDVIKHIHVTEKAVMLQELKNSKSTKSSALCESPKYVFVVDRKATKPEIANALEEIYREQNIKVVAVNTIQVKAKPTRKTRGKQGYKNAFKKAIVTLEPKDSLDNT
jgi:large subunit ribosomal protein L23